MRQVLRLTVVEMSEAGDRERRTATPALPLAFDAARENHRNGVEAQRMQAVYLDNNATTRVLPDVVSAMLPFFTDTYGNPSSVHDLGSAARGAMRQARSSLQTLIGARFADEIIFTSGGTEANSTAILSALDSRPDRDELVTTMVEHPAILALCGKLERDRGIRVHYIPVDRSGRLDVEAYRAALSPKTALASVMWANNETGTLFDVIELAAIAHQAGALFHTDAVQAAGKLAIDLKSTAIDMLSLSGHKFHAPKGIGALYLRRGTPFVPLLHGGRQERNRRAGTENVPSIVGLGHAADMATMELSESAERMRRLRDLLEAGLQREVGDCLVVGDMWARLPHVLTMAFAGTEGEAIVGLLARSGIACSTGAACAAGSMQPSHVLRAMDVPDRFIGGAVRFSLSRETTGSDVDRVLAITPGVVEGLRHRQPAHSADHLSERRSERVAV